MPKTLMNMMDPDEREFYSELKERHEELNREIADLNETHSSVGNALAMRRREAAGIARQTAQIERYVERRAVPKF